MNILFLDVESTGIDVSKNEVVEIACEFWQAETLVSKFNTLLELSGSNSVEVNLGALKVNSYLTRVESELLVSRPDAAASFVRYLVDLPKDKQNPIYVGGHNAAFDVVALKKFLADHNYSGWNEIFAINIIDTATIGNILREAGLINFDRMSLANLAKALNIEVNTKKTHGAKYDTELTARCYFEMLKLLRSNKKD